MLLLLSYLVLTIQLAGSPALEVLLVKEENESGLKLLQTW